MTSPSATGSQDWIRSSPHPTEPGAVNLVCLPHAGGSASFFFPLSRALAPQVTVLAVQYPGRQERYREPNIDSVPLLVDQIFDALVDTVTGPLALFGHSMGAVLAYEVALRLQRARLPEPLVLIASGRRAPSRYREENVHKRTDEQIMALMGALSGTGGDLLADDGMMRHILPAVRSDFRAVETYRHDPEARLTCPITVLTGTADPLTSLAEADGWREHTSGPVEVRTFPGGHFFLAEQAASVTSAIRAALATYRALGE
jgi:surfactin synthase thioesterase subunit